jgi:hypothetical protein
MRLERQMRKKNRRLIVALAIFLFKCIDKVGGENEYDENNGHGLALGFIKWFKGIKLMNNKGGK